jgi:glycosyltransferase involved in cell wall biosynthesis
MNILFIIDKMGSGGKERQLVELLTGLSLSNDVSTALVTLSPDIHYSDITELNLKIYCLQRKFKKDPSIIFKLYKICKEFQPEIIHSWESMCSIYALPVAKVVGAKFIEGSIRDAPLNLSLFDKRGLRSKITFLLSDVVVSNSLAGLETYKPPAKKSVCIYNGFDLSRTKKIKDQGLIREKFNINTPKVVGMVANFTDRKDYNTYLNAATSILRHREDVTFLAVGEGKNLMKSKEMIMPEYKGKIKFIGKQQDIESIVNIIDVGVLATYTEGVSNSILEYMAFGKPVVATKCNGTAEVVVHNKTGFLVKQSNVNEMSGKINFFLNNNETANEMGIFGKKRVFDDFSNENMINRYIGLYQKII